MDNQRMGEVIEGDTLRFVRVVPHSRERVWRAISDERELRAWMRYPVSFEQRVGGQVRFFGEGQIEGVVFVFDPPKTLAFSFWDAKDPEYADRMKLEWSVRWDLEEEGDACRITFVHRQLGGAHLWGLGEGWHGFLEQLGAYLDGTLDELMRHFKERGGDDYTEGLTQYRAHVSRELLSWTETLAATARRAASADQGDAARQAIDKMEFGARQLYEIARQDGPRPDYAPDPSPPPLEGP